MGYIMRTGKECIKSSWCKEPWVVGLLEYRTQGYLMAVSRNIYWSKLCKQQNAGMYVFGIIRIPTNPRVEERWDKARDRKKTYCTQLGLFGLSLDIHEPQRLLNSRVVSLELRNWNMKWSWNSSKYRCQPILPWFPRRGAKQINLSLRSCKSIDLQTISAHRPHKTAP